MRHTVSTAPSNESRVTSLFGFNPFVNTQQYFSKSLNGGIDPTVTSRLINTRNNTIMDKWWSLLRNAYGNFDGIKQDDMVIANQRKYNGNLSNLADDFTSLAMPQYNRIKPDLLSFGRNNWFNVSTDAQNNQGWTGFTSDPNGPLTPIGYQSSIYAVKYFIDSSLTNVASGYPHPFSEFHLLDVPSGSDINDPSIQKEFLRTEQLKTFWGATGVSHGFWHVKNIDHQNSMIFFYQLRNRLQPYAYSHAISWFETGIPSLIKPLFLLNNNPEIHKMYGRITNGTDPVNEYMFGNALLVRPLINKNATVGVYFPEGRWRSFFKPGIYPGNSTLDYRLYDSGTYNDFPVFFKEGNILLIKPSQESTEIQAYVFLDTSNQSTDFKYTSPTGEQYTIFAYKHDNNIFFLNKTTGIWSQATPKPYGKGWVTATVSCLFTSSTVPSSPCTKGNYPSTNPPATPAAPAWIWLSGTISPGQYTVGWEAPASATYFYYRIDDTSDSASCLGLKDDCPGQYLYSNRNYIFEEGKSYSIWVHAGNVSGYSAAFNTTVTIPSKITPTPIPLRPTCALGFDASKTNISTGTTLNFSVTSGNGGNLGYIVEQSTSGGAHTLLFSGSAPNGTGSYTFTTPGTYYISCNSINSSQPAASNYCQGSPISAGPDCGANDHTIITVNALSSPTPTPTPTVSIGDIINTIRNYGKTNSAFDKNSDGVINSFDWIITWKYLN